MCGRSKSNAKVVAVLISLRGKFNPCKSSFYLIQRHAPLLYVLFTKPVLHSSEVDWGRRMSEGLRNGTFGHVWEKVDSFFWCQLLTFFIWKLQKSLKINHNIELLCIICSFLYCFIKEIVIVERSTQIRIQQLEHSWSALFHITVLLFSRCYANGDSQTSPHFPKYTQLGDNKDSS